MMRWEGHGGNAAIRRGDWKLGGWVILLITRVHNLDPDLCLANLWHLNVSIGVVLQAHQ